MFPPAFLGIRRFIEIADFYNCLFLTVDRDLDIFKPIMKRKQLRYCWTYLHAIRLAFLVLFDIKQAISAGPLLKYIEARKGPERKDTWKNVIDCFDGKKVVFHTATPFKDNEPLVEILRGKLEKVFEISREKLEGKKD
ncbi:hypothetical protein Fcan01_23898 [Folsomia candida]|uniref:Uncharacterized protein n=1 Tax=Folsomia candida TaxID=158441 RepID=A0A226D8F2_FOLCA|nr:hypothetical protein Fcan01_23898 [Folsomia candida]